MSDLLGTAYARLRDQLLASVHQVSWPTPEAGFLHFLQCPGAIESDGLSTTEGRLNEAPILASNGYLYRPLRVSDLSHFDKEWARALERLLQRDPFPLDRESYFFRPLEILGVCIGARSCPQTTAVVKEQLRQFLIRGEGRIDESDLWSYSLTSYAAWQLGVVWKRRSVPLLQHLSLEELCLLRWLLKQEDFANVTGLECPQAAVDDWALRLGFTGCITSASPAKAGVTLVVLEQLVEERISSRLERTRSHPANEEAATEIVSNLARRFHSFALQLSCRHEGRETVRIKDEYDVQDLMHSLLKLHFEDVRPEEWTPSYAGYSTRMDFLLKREKIVVEAKMTRKGLDQKGVLKELAEDMERYRVHSDCKTLICFVYDPQGHCKNPTALEDDLRGQRDSLNVIVHVFPKP